MIEAIESLAWAAKNAGVPIVKQLKELISNLEFEGVQPTKKKVSTKKKVAAKPIKAPPDKVLRADVNIDFSMNKNKEESERGSVKWRGNKWKSPTNDRDESFTDLKTPKRKLAIRERGAANMQTVSCVGCRKTRRLNVDSLPNGTYKCDKCIIERR